MDKTTVVVVATILLVIMNIIAFALMGHDKKCAQKGKWRVLGMKVFHHKTKHGYFKVFFPVLLIVQIALLAFGAYSLFR